MTLLLSFFLSWYAFKVKPCKPSSFVMLNAFFVNSHLPHPLIPEHEVLPICSLHEVITHLLICFPVKSQRYTHACALKMETYRLREFLFTHQLGISVYVNVLIDKQYFLCVKCIQIKS